MQISVTVRFGAFILTLTTVLAVSQLRAAERETSLPNDAYCQGVSQVTIGDVVAARRVSDEYRAATLRFESSEFDKELVESFYMPIFKLNSQAGRGAVNEFNKDQSIAAQQDERSDQSSIALGVSQRLPGGATIGLTLNKEWGRSKSSSDISGVAANRSTQHYYQLEAKQPLLRGAGAAASAELNMGRLAIEQSRLNHQIFLQEDLLQTLNVYAGLVSSQQRVLQARRSLRASEDFLSATQILVSQDVLAKSEIAQAEYAVSQGQLELATALQAEKDAIDQIVLFSGLTIEEKQLVKGFADSLIDNDAANGVFPEFIIEIELAKLNVQMAEQNKLVAKNNNEFELNVVASMGKGWGDRYYTNELERNRGSGWRSQSYIGLELTKTLNDYPARSALKKSVLMVDEKQLELKDVTVRAKARRAKAFRDFSSAQRYMKIVRKKIEVATDNFNNERFKISAGRSTAFLVYAAQNNLEQAQSEYIEATSQYVVSAARVYKELGRLSEFVGSLSPQECSSNRLPEAEMSKE